MRPLILPLLCTATLANAADPTVDFGDNDAAMNTAIEQARASFDDFWTRVANADGLSDHGASIKVAVPIPGQPGSHEHIWMGPCKRIGGVHFICIVNNDPVDVDLKPGDAYPFSREAVSDWMIRRDDGKVEGAYTLRVILPRLSKDQADTLRPLLLPLPE